MNQEDKIEMLKPAIQQLYTNEGRSKNYISQLLEVDRKTLTYKIEEWGLEQNKSKKHLTPHNEKFINKNRDYIRSCLDKDVSITDIAKSLNVSRDRLQRLIPMDDVLKVAHKGYIERRKDNHEKLINKKMDESSYDYNIVDLPDEEWKPILGYPGYEVSNRGRVKHFATRYKAYHLMQPCPNKNNGRLYVLLVNEEGKSKNLMVARLVAHAFVEGYDDVHNTVNHKDLDVKNNWVENLEWVSQAENNQHAANNYSTWGGAKSKLQFSKLVYKDKYEFKTIAALARFLDKSQTQTRRYLDNPEKYDIKIIK